MALITGKIRIDYNDESQEQVKQWLWHRATMLNMPQKNCWSIKNWPNRHKLTSWVSDEISFTDASLEEITETLQDRFGYTVNTKDTRYLN